MPLARTPPLKAPSVQRREDTFAPSQAFLPQNPGVRRTPPPGRDSPHAGSPPVPALARSLGAGGRAPPEDDSEMDIDEGLLPTPEKIAAPPRDDRPIRPAAAVADAVGDQSPIPVVDDGPGTPPRAPAINPATGVPRTPARTPRRASRAARASMLAVHSPSPEPIRIPSPPIRPARAFSREPSLGASRARSQSPARLHERELSHGPPRPPSPEMPVAGPSTAHPPVTPSRRQSRTARTPAKTPAEVLAQPAVPIADADEAGYGKYYEALVRTLRINAIDRGLGKLSLEHMRECFPLLEAENRETLANVWSTMSFRLRADVLQGAYELLDDYKVPKRLLQYASIIEDAKAWEEEHPGEARPDAWRPDLTPAIISTGTNLEVYDDAWASLRETYTELSQECGERYARVKAKRAQLAAMDNGVSDSVVELAKTNELLKDFPSAEMMNWAESMETNLGRHPDPPS